LLAIVPTKALAKTECEDVIKACDTTIAAKDKDIELWKLTVTQVSTENASLRYAVDDRDEKLRSPIRNPFVMTAVGVLVGIIATGYALKK
jgi:hypothetical protein